jgi:hypothetical protein
MTDAEFSALAQGDQFQRAGKVYTVVRTEGTHVVSRPSDNSQLLVHFLPHQVSQLTQIERQPEAPARRKSSHGFPLIERPEPRLPQPHMSSESTPSICISLDGGLAEARRGNEIGTPIQEGLEFLVNATAAGIDVQICTHRPQNVVWGWLHLHCPGTENVVQVSPHPPLPGQLYLSRHACRIYDDVYPTVDELRELIHPSQDEKEPATTR